MYNTVMYSLLYHTTIIFPGATLGEVPVHAGVQSPVGSALIGEEPASPPPATPAQGLGSEVDSPVEVAPTPVNFGLPPQQPVPNNFGLPPQPPPPPVGGVPIFQQNGAPQAGPADPRNNQFHQSPGVNPFLGMDMNAGSSVVGGPAPSVQSMFSGGFFNDGLDDGMNIGLESIAKALEAKGRVSSIIFTNTSIVL